MIISYDISELIPYINWPYFFFAWQVKEPSEKDRLRQEAETLLKQLEGKYRAYGLFELFDAHSDGDDIVVVSGEKLEVRGEKLEVRGERIPKGESNLKKESADKSLTSQPSPLTTKRKFTYKEKREFEQLEKEIAALEAEQHALEEALCSGTLSVEELTEKSKRLPLLKDELDEKSLRWLELSEIEN